MILAGARNDASSVGILGVLQPASMKDLTGQMMLIVVISSCAIKLTAKQKTLPARECVKMEVIVGGKPEV